MPRKPFVKPMEDASSLAARNEQIRSELIRELEAVIKAAIAAPYSSKENVPSEITQNLCNTIEALFIHGLKDPFFQKGTRYAKYPEPNFWPFVSKFSHRGVTDQILRLKQIKTEIGKSRAWIRLVINENSIEQYFELIGSEKFAIQQFYADHAFLRFLRDGEYAEQIRGIIKPLSKLPICAATNSTFLNSWTPTPLILAGLMSGEPLRVGMLTSRKNKRAGSESEEIAVSALDMLVPEQHHNIGSPTRTSSALGGSKGRLIGRRPTGQHKKPSGSDDNDDDDNSSVYSHPSLVDRGELSHHHAVGIHSPDASATSTNSSPTTPSSAAGFSGTRSRAIPAMRTSRSQSHLPFPQSPLLTSTPLERTILEAAARGARTNVFVNEQLQTSSSRMEFGETSADFLPGVDAEVEPVIVSRRTRRPRKSNSQSSSGTQSVASDEKSRQSRANSDLPSTIVGTMPEYSCVLEGSTPIHLHVSETLDSGIGFDARKDASLGDRSERSLSLLDAINRMAATSTTSMDLFGGSGVASTSGVDDVDGDGDGARRNDVAANANAMEQLNDRDIGDEDVFIAADENEKDASTSSLQKADDELNDVDDSGFDFKPSTSTAPIGMRKNEGSDSLLGTSLRDELLDATQPTSLSSFDQETPLFVMPPMIMGNSLAAIGARNQMTWESMSERSRLSSSSDSGGGPMMSFGQALRSAMEVGGRSSDGEESSDANIADETTSSTSRKSSVAVETTEKLSRIPREKGLDAQEFRCALCRKSIGGPAYAKFETCALDGMYYCVTCMNPGGTSPIPSRVIAGWDWKERRISDRGRAWIEAHQEKAVLNIDECNAQLYQRVASLEEVRLLREKLQIVSMYLFTCRDSVADDFRRRVWPKEYLHTDIHRYSFVDLLDVKSGALKKRLTLLLKHAAGHVMSCPLCRQKGFVCELCPIGDVIYPFDVEATHRCRVCFSVYHKPCWTTAPECPKCSRRAQFDARRALIDEPHSLLLLQP